MKLYFLLAIACSKSTAREGAQLDIKRTVVSKAINLLFSNIKIGPGATCKGSPGDEGYLVMREGKREGGVVVSSKWGSSIPLQAMCNKEYTGMYHLSTVSTVRVRKVLSTKPLFKKFWSNQITRKCFSAKYLVKF